MADTIAYSDKYGFWTSRYSFVPTCYASVDNHFFSCKDGENSGVYKHDVDGEDYNTFYNETFPSEIIVSSNQDPSAIKAYDSISLEVNRNSFTAEVFTNEEYDGIESQQGSLIGFESKEGFQYAEMPKSVTNSSNNIFVLPSPLQFIDGGLLSVDGGRTKTFTLPSIPESGLPVSVNDDYRVYQVLNGTLVNPGQTVDSLGLEVYATEISGNVITLKFLTPDTESLNLFGIITASPDDVDVEQPDITAAFYTFNLVILSPSNIDGDSMRGPYAKIKNATQEDASIKPFELHAINVDYSFSKLDARLTQNT